MDKIQSDRFTDIKRTSAEIMLLRRFLICPIVIMNTPVYSLIVQIERSTVNKLSLHHTEVKSIKLIILAHISSFPIGKVSIRNS